MLLSTLHVCLPSSLFSSYFDSNIVCLSYLLYAYNTTKLQRLNFAVGEPTSGQCMGTRFRNDPLYLFGDNGRMHFMQHCQIAYEWNTCLPPIAACYMTVTCNSSYNELLLPRRICV
jgi:hypothetical protein